MKYSRTTSPLPSHVSPKKYCTQAAGAISKLLRVYKRSYGLKQICNIAVYIAHSACTIHLLNLPDKNAKRDIVHGLKHLEEIGEMWTCARRTVRILNVMAQKWKTDLPEEAVSTFSRTQARWGSVEPARSPSNSGHSPQTLAPPGIPESTPQSSFDQQAPLTQVTVPNIPSYLPNGYFAPHPSNEQDPSGAQQSLTHHSIPTPALAPPPRHPTTGPEFSRPIQRVGSSTELTKAQQDAWNAHQASRLQVANNQPSRSAIRRTDPSVLFGGVASLVEESQEWWLKDQSALAMGFDNWGDPTAAGRPAAPPNWSMFGYGMPARNNEELNDGNNYGYGNNDFSGYGSNSQPPRYHGTMENQENLQD